MLPIAYNIRNLRARRLTNALSAGGVALVVFVLASALMLQAGIRRTLGRAGNPSNAIVLRKGGVSEMASVITDPAVSIVRASPGLARGPDGSPLAIAELVLIKYVERADGVGGGNLQIRGVPANVLAFRPEVHVVEGRAPRPGVDEAMIGKAIRGRFKGLDVGQPFEVRKNRNVQVVGVFEAQGSAHESEVWLDLETARSAFGREGVVSSVRARLQSPQDLETLSNAVAQDKRLGLQVMREDQYFEKQSEGTATFMGVLGIVIAFFASIGAMIGAASTMYAAVNQRRRETGVLRALGFSRRTIVASFLVESFILALTGAAVGAAASLLMMLVRFSIMNMASFSQVVFEFHPTPAVVITALVAGGAMGLIGGLLPAIRAARLPLVQAIRG